MASLDLGERSGMVVTLAQPNLTAISGETAEFLAGGEYPIPLPGNFAGTTLEYRKSGVSLAYTPTVLSNGRISLENGRASRREGVCLSMWISEVAVYSKKKKEN